MYEDTVIKLKNFSFSYDEKNKILRNIILDIKEGERILILGPSGCVKSTLTLCLNSIIPQLIEGKIEGTIQGTILIKNMNVLDIPISNLTQHIGIVFQDPESQFYMLTVEDEILEFTGFVFQNPEHQFVEDSVYKEVVYGLKIRYQNELYINKKANEILMLMGLENLKDTNPFNLSQGQKNLI